MAYADNIFTAMIDENGAIWEAGTGRKRQAVGVDLQREQELLAQISQMTEILDSWRPKMIEHGYIQEPKTPEQIAQEAAAEQIRIAQEQAEQQSQINQALLQAIQSLKGEIGELRANGNRGHSNEFGGESIGQNSKSSGEKPTGSKKGSATGTKNAPGNNE